MIDVLKDFDKRDRAILQWLRFDGRLTVAQLARKTGLPKDTVNYRLKRLKDRGIINRRYALPDYGALGYLEFRTYLKLQHTTPDIEEEIADAIFKIPGTRIMARMQGDFSFGWVTLARSPLEFNERLQKLLSKYSQYVQDKQVGIMTLEIPLAPWAPTPDKVVYRQKQFGRVVAHDEVDLHILRALYADAEQPLYEIADAAGVSPSAARLRIKRMEKNGIIRVYRIDADFSLTYYKVKVNLENINSMHKVYEFAQANHGVVLYIFHALGGADVELDVFVPKFADLLQLIDELKVKLKSDLKNYSYHTFTHLKIAKDLPFDDWADK